LTHAILPTAGKATRMRGLPKFLLPAGPDYLTLIERHVSALLEVCDTIWIPTRPEQAILLDALGLSSDRVVIVPLTTKTMTETVLRITQISESERFLMVMPDTYFSGEKPYKYLVESQAPMSLAAWSIRDEQLGKLGQILIDAIPEGSVLEAEDKNPLCEFRHSWGAMAFSRGILQYFSPEMAHTGYALPQLINAGLEIHARVMKGSYFDCGTPSEYIQMLTSGLS